MQKVQSTPNKHRQTYKDQLIPSAISALVVLAVALPASTLLGGHSAAVSADPQTQCVSASTAHNGTTNGSGGAGGSSSSLTVTTSSGGQGGGSGSSTTNTTTTTNSTNTSTSGNNNASNTSNTAINRGLVGVNAFTSASALNDDLNHSLNGNVSNNTVNTLDNNSVLSNDNVSVPVLSNLLDGNTAVLGFKL